MTTVVKRGPGRPCKEVKPPEINIKGILTAPDRPGDRVELIYSNPVIFKQIVALYTSYNTDEFDITFGSETVTISGMDHNKKSAISAVFEGKNLDMYYCSSPLRVRAQVKDLNIVLAKLTKQHRKITFLMTIEDLSTLQIIVCDVEYDRLDTYDIDVVLQPSTTVPQPFEDETTYPINMKVSSKHFKQLIEHAQLISKTLTIQKTGNNPLQFTSDRSKKISWKGIYNDPAQIDLKSTIAVEDSFSVSIYIEFIKPFSKTTLGKNTYISADKEERICFKTMMDQRNGWTCTVKIFTEIANLRTIT